MKLFIFISLLLPVALQAQTRWYDVTYKVEFNFGMAAEKKSKLVFNSTEAYYTEGVAQPKSGGKDDTKLVVQDMAKKGFSEIFVTDSKNKKFITKHQLGSTPYWVEEKLFPIEWEIDRTAKATVLGYECFKAMGVFRGRHYTAWFTEEIPVKFGPWKVNGLPGLILEASDSVGEVSFAVERIEQLKNFDPKVFQLVEKEADFKKITLQEYVNIVNENNKNFLRTYVAKLPRDAKIKNVTFNDKHSGYELKYEWEK